MRSHVASGFGQCTPHGGLPGNPAETAEKRGRHPAPLQLTGHRPRTQIPEDRAGPGCRLSRSPQTTGRHRGVGRAPSAHRPRPGAACTPVPGAHLCPSVSRSRNGHSPGSSDSLGRTAPFQGHCPRPGPGAPPLPNPYRRILKMHSPFHTGTWFIIRPKHLESGHQGRGRQFSTRLHTARPWCPLEAGG